MAERVVSPGVFTNEIDASFLPAAISNIGAALIGICSKGPAFVPTIVNSYSDFKVKFGGLNPSYHLPYTAKSYLKSSGTATVVRVLGKSGYTATQAITIKGGSAVTAQSASGSVTVSGSSLGTGDLLRPIEGDYIAFNGSNGTVYKFISQDNISIPDDNESENLYYFSQEFDYSYAGEPTTLGDFLASGSTKMNTVSSGMDILS